MCFGFFFVCLFVCLFFLFCFVLFFSFYLFVCFCFGGLVFCFVFVFCFAFFFLFVCLFVFRETNQSLTLANTDTTKQPAFPSPSNLFFKPCVELVVCISQKVFFLSLNIEIKINYLSEFILKDDA